MALDDTVGICVLRTACTVPRAHEAKPHTHVQDARILHALVIPGHAIHVVYAGICSAQHIRMRLTCEGELSRVQHGCIPP